MTQLNEWGKPLRDANLTFGWHNHDFEFTEITSSIRPIDIILSASNYLSLELDVAWAMSTDADVLNFVSQHRARISAAHIKDIAPAGLCLDEDGWADVGHGTLDWESLFPALLAAGTQYFIMEHDNPTDDKRFAKRSIEYASPLLNSLR